jgi:hypothetical protein
MELKDILKLGERDAIGQEEFAKFNEVKAYNGVKELYARIYGPNLDDTQKETIEASWEMPEHLRRSFLEASVSQYQNELIAGVSGNITKAVRGFKKKKDLAAYLLASDVDPSAHKGEDDFMSLYQPAYQAARLIKAVQEDDQEKVGKAVNEYVKSDLDRLKKKGVDAGMIAAAAWAYKNNSKGAMSRVVDGATKAIKAFEDKVNFDDAKQYLEERFVKLDKKKQAMEALRIGRAIFKAK